jgi:adenylate cyclase
VAGYSVEEVAERAGVTVAYFEQLIGHGIARPSETGRFTDGDAHRAAALHALTESGVPLDRVAAAVNEGGLSLDFMDSPVYERFAAVSGETFAQVCARTGLSFELLAAVREGQGSPAPSPEDRIRENELRVVPFLSRAQGYGVTALSLERFLRVMGDSLRSVAETEADWWYREILMPRLALGMGAGDLDPEASNEMSLEIDEAVLAVYHGQQGQTWMRNFIRGMSGQLEDAGLHEQTARLPAICFLDVTGYTRLTAERGDAAAAHLAEQLARLVQRTSGQHGGRPIKWLGDGVMFYFEDPRRAVQAALEMVEGVDAAGLPPAHVGVHSGPVVFQQGDYYGQTVNICARIADFARPREVLVSHAAFEAADAAEVEFEEIGPVELKGVAAPLRLYAARRAT